MTSQATRKALRLNAREAARTIKAAADKEALIVAEQQRLATLHLSPAGYWIAMASDEVIAEPATYRPGGEHQFFRDMLHRSIDPSAAERIGRNQRQMEMEARTGTTANLAGLIPPQYLIDMFAPVVRSGRIVANLVTNLPLPPTGTSFNLGRGTTGTLVGVQASENATLSNQDYDDTLLTFSMTTLGGYTEMSRQEIERSVNGDQIVIADLASIYANVLNSQCISGSGSSGQFKGILNATGIQAVTYTDASPTVPEAFPKIADAIQQINANRQLPAEAIVMHPRRWGWFTAALDSQNRPLVSVNGQAFNPVGTDATAAAGVGGPVGTLMGLPVFTDPGVPTNLGGSTNEDRIIVGRFSDALLYEDEGVVPFRVYEEPGSAALTVRIVVAGFGAFTAERYATAFSVISGTGLATPSF